MRPGPDDDPPLEPGREGLSEPAPGLAAGTKVGQLIVLRNIGEGGMGVVVAAYDPALDRQVAIKVLRASDIRDPETARARMRREAQAMAKLTHPNVLPVYEVGSHKGEVFVVMELVDGPTLSEWLSSTDRTWQEIVECLRSAGRGLAAAHAAQLVHRDFKPDNILIGSDGRPRVADFGIASIVGEGAEVTPETVAEHERRIAALRSETSSKNQTALTQTGMMVGTPAYMAPEQFTSERVDARADQFAFCVVLWEALYGVRPFGPSVVSVLSGRSSATPHRPGGDAVPRPVREAISRGLALDPESRHESMDDLLRALAPPAPESGRLSVIAAVALALIATGIAVAAWRAPAPCPEPSLAGTWDASARDAIRSRFRATELGFAEASLEATLAALDAYAAAWSGEHVAACRATAVDHVQSENLLDLRMQCLDRRRDDLGSLVGALAEADGSAIERSIDGVAMLPAVRGCGDTTALLDSTPLPQDPERRRAIGAARRQLSVARAKLATGHGAEGLVIVESLFEEVSALAFGPLTAEALLLRGDLEVDVGQMDASVETYAAAMRAAAAADADDVLLRAAAQRAGTLVIQFGRVQEVLAQRVLLESLAMRSSDSALAAFARSRIAIAVERAGDAEQAVEIQRGVVADLIEYRGERDRLTALAINNLASFRKNSGDLEGALRDYGRALEVLESLLGDSHPGLTFTLSGMGVTHSLVGEFERAERELGRALRIIEVSHGADYPGAGDVCWYIALNLLRMGRSSEAIAYATRSAELLREFGGSRLAWPLRIRANALAASGQSAAALAALDEALPLLREDLGSEHPETAKAYQELAAVHLALGDLPAARAALDRALPVLEASRTEPRWHYEAMLTEAAYFRATGDGARANLILTRVLSDARTRLGERHVVVAAATEALALVQTSGEAPGISGRD